MTSDFNHFTLNIEESFSFVRNLGNFRNNQSMELIQGGEGDVEFAQRSHVITTSCLHPQN